MSTLRNCGRRLGVGRAAYALWHAPVGVVRTSVAAGGPLEQWRDSRDARAMAEAASQLPTLHAPLATDFAELHFLTGKCFWYQTAFCLWSLQMHSERTFRVVFHDDGSLDDECTAPLQKLFPAAELRRRNANDQKIGELLPPARFPFLHDRRKSYPNILKLTDAHAGAPGARLVLDSDILFFRKPEFLLEWLTAPNRALHMADIGDAYGYPLPLMESLADASIPHFVNAGLTGLNSEMLDWEKIEFWCHRLIEARGTSYYLEQALVAMLVAGHDCAVAPAADYVLAPDESECRTPRATMHHYVAESKRGYFRHGWRRVFSLTQ